VWGLTAPFVVKDDLVLAILYNRVSFPTVLI